MMADKMSVVNILCTIGIGLTGIPYLLHSLVLVSEGKPWMGILYGFITAFLFCMAILINFLIDDRKNRIKAMGE